MRNLSKRKLIAAALSVSFLLQQSALMGALATDISGVTGNNGIYNINPETIKGETGFRQYENFNLSKGDIANLIFKYGADNIEHFINLVDNKINIEGIVNSMRDNQFYNGHAIFVSPNGMVVGASGVLNVGSLSVYTPSQADYKRYINGGYEGDLASLERGTADIKINGKVFTKGDINLIGRDVAINSKGALIAGANNGGALLTSHEGADILFNSLVNTSNIKPADKIAIENGNIMIKTDVRDGGIDIAGLVKNNGKGNISIANNGTENLNVSGKIENADGNVSLVNRKSNISITGDISNSGGTLSAVNNGGYLSVKSSANVNNKGELRLVNRNGKELVVNGNVSNDGVTLISSNSGKVTIGGKLANKNDTLTIVSNGSGLEVKQGAEISNNAAIKMANTGKDGFKMNGTIKNSGSTALTNWWGDFTIGGEIQNTEGKMNLSNADSKMTITKDARISNNGDLQIINAGQEGLTIDGAVRNNSTTNIQSVKGDLDINGDVINTNGKLTIQNSGNALNTGKNSTITNNNTTVITNSGEGGMNLNGMYMGSGYTTIENTNGDLNINNTVAQNGKRLVVKNSGNALNINSSINGDKTDYIGSIISNGADVTIFNSGEGGTNINGVIAKSSDDTKNISIVNQNGGLNIYDADILNTNGNLSISNSGSEALRMDENSTIANKNGTLTIVNGSEKGADIDGLIENNGKMNITNLKGHIATNAVIKNTNGRLEIVNNGSGMTLDGNSYISNNNEIKIANTGAEGLKIKGNIENNGSTAISNWNGDFVISGKVENSNGKMNITSAQKSSGLHLTKEGQILNNNDELLVQNTGKNGIILDGQVKNNSATTIYNTSGDLKVNGLVQNKGTLMITNRGKNLTVGQNAIIANDGKTTVRNSGVKGMNIDGIIINQNGPVNIENNAGALNMSKDSWIISKNDAINIKNNSGYSAVIDGTLNSLDSDNILIENKHENGGITIGSNAVVKTDGNVNLTNVGSKAIKVQGNVQGKDINVTNSNSHLVLGSALMTEDSKPNLQAENNVNITQENGSVLNAGTKQTMIAAGKNLNIKVNNGKIGVETGTSGGGYTYGPDGSQVDTAKSINVDVKGRINAETNDTIGNGGDYVINLSSKGSDMNIGHIKADGRVILLTDLTADGKTGSILNAAQDATKANIEAKGLSLISSGSIGTDEKALTFNDTNYAYKSDYEALGDINIKALDDQYSKADVRYIISRDGKIKAEFTGNARVKDTYSGAGVIDVTNRTGNMNLINNGSTPNTGLTYFNFLK